MELLVLGKFPWRQRWVVGAGQTEVQFLRPKSKSIGFCSVVASCSSILLLSSPPLLLFVRDFAEMNGAGHFHLSMPCPGSVTRVYLSN